MSLTTAALPAVPLTAIIGWSGLFIHNLAELPGQSLLSPESFIPLLVTAILVAGWFTPIRHAATLAMLGWGLLHFFGGGLISVLPLPFLPFLPEQTLSHYCSTLFTPWPSCRSS
ncbi:hypothetical protein DC347_10540 [Pseudarthrobacter sp. AG30]|uniref:hypothetical protein n=1 Tax=Pseudarthrobacter sp. AG30 TaxID=2249742 RepID=UPI000D64CEDE|nr:hypothetical protein [Pseudarthrobacter sp. AG30]RAX17046.1 hypothetical protein DC347_10540 [Pseudarthrobacter sp. AG30]